MGGTQRSTLSTLSKPAPEEWMPQESPSWLYSSAYSPVRRLLPLLSKTRNQELKPLHKQGGHGGQGTRAGGRE